MKSRFIKQKNLSSSALQSIRELKSLDNWRNAVYIFLDYGTVALGIILYQINQNFLSYIVAILLISSRMRALENLLHESSHGNLFKNKTLNDWIGFAFCAFPIGSSASAYRESHNLHHRALGDPKLDPDRVRYRDLGIEEFPVSRKALVIHLLKVITLTHVPKYLKSTLKCFCISPTASTSEVVARWIFGIAIVISLTGMGLWKEFILFWIIPFLSFFQVIRYLAEMSEHGGLYGAKDEINLTRNNFCHPVLRFLQYPHGDYYHLVHHLLPSVPHYKLGAAHELLLESEEYNQAHHCYGYFFPKFPDEKSTLMEMITQQETNLSKEELSFKTSSD